MIPYRTVFVESHDIVSWNDVFSVDTLWVGSYNFLVVSIAKDVLER